MAETGLKSSQTWTSTQAYVTAVLCLLLGVAVGYLLRGSTGASIARVQPAATGQQMPSPEQLKAMADKQAAPFIAQLKTKPNDLALNSQIGDIYYDAQVFPVAIEYYQKALAIDPRNSAARTDMATAMFYNNGDIDQAIAELDRALKDDPRNSNALFSRGIVKWQGKMDISGAVADWELLLKQNPNSEQADKIRMYITQAKKHANIKPGQKTSKPAM
ncbi:MAG: hypothetical protein CXZ00_04745 [Acidobacteria bacterium]|nr:MAG: hypothetical protein CXZ00_04745 [Acidobacteriota bacterium]